MQLLTASEAASSAVLCMLRDAAQAGIAQPFARFSHRCRAALDGQRCPDTTVPAYTGSPDTTLPAYSGNIFTCCPSYSYNGSRCRSRFRAHETPRHFRRFSSSRRLPPRQCRSSQLAAQRNRPHTVRGHAARQGRRWLPVLICPVCDIMFDVQLAAASRIGRCDDEVADELERAK